MFASYQPTPSRPPLLLPILPIPKQSHETLSIKKKTCPLNSTPYPSFTKQWNSLCHHHSTNCQPASAVSGSKASKLRPLTERSNRPTRCSFRRKVRLARPNKVKPDWVKGLKGRFKEVWRAELHFNPNLFRKTCVFNSFWWVSDGLWESSLYILPWSIFEDWSPGQSRCRCILLFGVDEHPEFTPFTSFHRTSDPFCGLLSPKNRGANGLLHPRGYKPPPNSRPWPKWQLLVAPGPEGEHNGVNSFDPRSQML